MHITSVAKFKAVVALLNDTRKGSGTTSITTDTSGRVLTHSTRYISAEVGLDRQLVQQKTNLDLSKWIRYIRDNPAAVRRIIFADTENKTEGVPNDVQ